MNTQGQQKNIFVVLGMARTGTSAIARGVNALGIDFGTKLEKPNQFWNPKGFWEDVDIVFKINRGVLYALNHDWMSINLHEEGWQQRANLKELRKSAQEILKERTASTDYFGFKDPRTAVILPFWQDVFADLGLNEHYIIALRNPLATAHSYHRVSGVDIEIGLLMWIKHLLLAIDATHHKNRIMVNYDLMLKNPREQLERIKSHFHISQLTDNTSIDLYVNEFLDKKLQHFDHDANALKKDPATELTPVCIKMYELFIKLANDTLAFDSEAFKQAWFDEIKPEFLKVWPMYRYLDVFRKRNKNLERQLRTIQKSLPYKFVAPLRVIDDYLRNLRRHKREKNRLLRSYET